MSPTVASSRLEDSRLFCCRCAYKRHASPLTCITICFLVLTYNIIGGFLFLAIEGNSVQEETFVAASKSNLSQSQSGDLNSRTVERLWSITEDLNILYKENWTKLAAKELMDFQRVLIESMLTGDEQSISTRSDAVDYRWTFAGCFLYALTLITTIGYGNISPKSSTGKIVAIAYSCMGIPLIMLYLSTVGETLASSFRTLYSKLCPTRLNNRNFHSKANCLRRFSLLGAECKLSVNCDKNDKLYERGNSTPFQAALNLRNFSSGYHWTCSDHTRVPIVLSLLLIILYVVVGIFLFHITERWSFIDECYFSFSSLATIGFGHLKPGLYARNIPAKSEDMAISVCCIYLLVGIVVVAMCFNLIQEDISSALRRFVTLCNCNSRTRTVHSAEKSEENNISVAVMS